MRILSIPFSPSTVKLFVLLFGFLISFTFLFPVSYAEVIVPPEEYLGYFDSNGVFTVIGNVKNNFEYAIIPTIDVSIKDNSETFTKTIRHVPLSSGSEVPFKIKFPEVSSDNPVLLPPNITFEITNKDPLFLEVIYDETLVQYEDGHLTGRIQNTGNTTIFNPKIYAVIHGYEQVLDIVQNMEHINKIDPGEIVNFSMYPDPSVTDDVFYYSCFAPVDTTVVPVTTIKNGEEFDFRYDSGAWYSAAKFNEEGTVLSIRGYNSYPLETYANFEFAPISGNEKFDVTLNDEPIEFIQSIDEMGYWHVAFNVDPRSQGVLKISGFEVGIPPQLSKIPNWIKLNANWWATDQISDDEFLEGIDFLIQKELVSAPMYISDDSKQKIPQWLKSPANWWATDQISDDEFLKIIEILIQRQKIIV